MTQGRFENAGGLLAPATWALAAFLMAAAGCAPPADPEPKDDPRDRDGDCAGDPGDCMDAAADSAPATPDACVATGAEGCDGVDNDCNGLIDDGLDCDAPAAKYNVTCNLYDGFNTLQSTVNDFDGRATDAFGNILCGPNNCGVSAADCKAKQQGMAEAPEYPVLFKLFSDGGANAVEVQTFRFKVGTPVGGGANWCGTPVGGGAAVCRKWFGKGEAKLPGDAIAKVKCRTHVGATTSEYSDAVHWNGSKMIVPAGDPMTFVGDCVAE